MLENLTYLGSGNFTGTGNGLANVIAGGSFADTLDGGGGADTLIGGSGNDTYIVNLSGDQIVELEGEGDGDVVRSSVSYTLADNIENLVLTGGSAINATGNALSNRLTGNTGANTLDGGAGADLLSGGAGNDTYFVDNSNDALVELAGQGTDTVRTTVSEFGLEAFANVENMTFIGFGEFSGRGNELANILTGGSESDTLQGNGGADTLVGGLGHDDLDGGAGADTMRGGAGNDDYFVDNALDRVTENINEGTDTVFSSINFTLGSNIENLTLTGSAVSGTGNGLANVITGSDLRNTLNGGAGNDIIIGNGGADTLTGGTGTDTFVFALGFGNDRITDFDANPTGGQDFLDLTGFGITAADFGGRVTIADIGADTLVTIDGATAQSIQLTGLGNATTLTQQDFLLVG